MNDVIDRQMAIDMFQNLAYDDWNQGVVTTWANAYSKAAEKIRDLPSAQKRGEWNFEESPDGYYHAECSECGHY